MNKGIIRFIALVCGITLLSCNNQNQVTNIEKENALLKKQVNTLTNELHKYDTLLNVYEKNDVKVSNG
ncbi:hypothetical protein ABN763_16095 [Spongiivirga sp. MCCC 1A20706]|uniref:hypothetical protein n=1 Tax=Spongiivirga sp. MCCC 1A20706 TaxID=3160963 RepID=UPI003977AF85